MPAYGWLQRVRYNTYTVCYVRLVADCRSSSSSSTPLSPAGSSDPDGHPSHGKLHLGELDLSEAQIGHFQRSETTFSELSSSQQLLSVRTMRWLPAAAAAPRRLAWLPSLVTACLAHHATLDALMRPVLFDRWLLEKWRAVGGALEGRRSGTHT
eukprot:COSAG01_NODE_3646_length_5830_cov_7.276217_5_plen_154_part_00